MGQIGILSVGAGDTKLTFDKSNPAETIRSGRIVKDMLRRGYALLVEVPDGKGGTTMTRVHDFDPETSEYIIADLDPLQAAKADEAEHVEPSGAAARGEAGAQGGGAGNPEPRRRGRPPKIRVAASGTSGVAVARSAGG